jgi:methyl-accepting chemotaxis protein
MSEREKATKLQYGLRFKVTAMMTVLFVTLGLILSWFSMSRTMTSLEEELKRRGVSLAKTLAYNGERAVAAGDNKAMMSLVKNAVKELDVAYAIILDVQGKVLAHTDSSLIGRSELDEPTRKGMGVKETTVLSYRDANGEEMYDVIAPVMAKTEAGVLAENENRPIGEKIGFVRVGLSLKNLKAQLKSNLLLSILITSAVVAVGIVISFFFVRYIVKPVEQMAVISTQIAAGDFSQTIQVLSRAQFDDEIGVLARAFSAMSSNLNEIIKKIRTAANNVASAADQISNTSQRASGGANVQAEAIDKTSSSMEEMNASMKEIAESVTVLSSAAEASASSILQMTASISEVANNTVNLSSSVEDTSASIIEMSASIKQVAQNSEVLSSAAEETALAANEINASIKGVENSSKEAAAVSERAASDAREIGAVTIKKTIQGMNKIRETVVASAHVINKLGQRSEQIGKILTVIDEVTKQTNLLALNAAILAAQAGEQGKGFAVVADEIRNLADRTASSTKEISQLIIGVQAETKEAVEAIKTGSQSVEEGVRLTKELGEALAKILDSTKQSSAMSRDIERATMEQAKGIRQITEAMQQVNGMVRQIAKAIQEQSRGSEQIMQAAERMREVTRQVRLSTDEQAKGGKQITQAVENVTDRVQQIVKAITEQKRGSHVIKTSIEEIRAIAQQSVQLVGQMNQAVETLTKQSALLREEMVRFKIRG